MKKKQIGSFFGRWRRKALTAPVELSERDTLQVVALLEHPPSPTAKLSFASKAWAANHRKLLNTGL